MPIRQTHTFVTLEVSKAAYDEIAEKLKAADYGHCFIRSGGKVLIDMHGIALEQEKEIESNELPPADVPTL